jgi:hypothetical protein
MKEVCVRATEKGSGSRAGFVGTVSVREDKVPQEFIQVLRRELAAQQAPDRHPKIDRIRPGGPPRVRMPSTGEIARERRGVSSEKPDLARMYGREIAAFDRPTFVTGWVG